MYHNIILTTNDILCFGSNTCGQLGLEQKNVIKPSSLLYLSIFKNSDEIQQIACGDHHSLILKNNGELYIFW